MIGDNILKRGLYLKRSTYFSSNSRPQYIQYPSIDLYVENECGLPDEKGSVHHFNLEDIKETSEKSEIQNIVNRISNIDISQTEVDKPLYNVLSGTIEGQELIEYVVAENTEWESPLKLPIPENQRHISDFDTHNTSADTEVSGKWRTEEYLERRRKEDQLDIDITVPTGDCTYVIRLEDSDGFEWLYVGETSNILSRIGDHMDKGGDSSSLNHKEMRLCGVEEVRPDGNEHEHYLEIMKEYDIPDERITGGK